MRFSRAEAAAVLVAVAALVSAGSAGSKSDATPFHWRKIISGLSAPLHATAPRSEPGNLYIVQQTGQIVRFVKGKRQSTPFLNISRLVTCCGEQGLLSLAFHPDYAHNRRFYVDYTDTNGDTRVVEYRANAAGTAALLSSRRQLVEIDQPYSNHNGGQLAFGPDGFLYIGMGDGGSGGDPENRSQNLKSLLGKLLRIDATTPGAKPKIVGYGLRNPWRFSFDRSTGDLYIGDVGQDRWEEVDYLPAKRPALMNFGWSRYEGKAVYNSARKLQGTGVVEWPVVVYGHGIGCSTTGGFVYRGSAIAAAKGLYFYGDYCSGRVWTLRIVNRKATGVTLLPQGIDQLSSFGEDANGNLYAVSLDGFVYLLVKG